MPRVSEWSMERKLSVSTLLLVMAQIIGGVWFLATLTGDVKANTAWRVANAETVVRLDERSSHMVKQLDELKAILRANRAVFGQ